MAGHAPIDSGHLHEVQILGDVLDENLADLDGGIDEIDQREIAKEVREARPDGVQPALNEPDTLREVSALSVYGGPVGPDLSELPVDLFDLIVQGDPAITGGEEICRQHHEFFFVDSLSGRCMIAFLVVELLGIVDRLELPLFDVAQVALVPE